MMRSMRWCAGFPAGTVSGAPKVRAMEIIDELESEKRGVYAGCVGYFSADGEMDTCIVLRTAIVKDGKMYVQAGAGIVADSVPESEHQRMRQQGEGPVPRRRGGRALCRPRREGPMIILIDNYDSFTWNLFHYLGDLGAETVVHRNDKISVGQVISAKPAGDRAVARALHAQRSRHLPRTHREGLADHPHPRRLPRPPGDRPGLRRQGHPRAEAHARQAVHASTMAARACSTTSPTISRRRAIIR